MSIVLAKQIIYNILELVPYLIPFILILYSYKTRNKQQFFLGAFTLLFIVLVGPLIKFFTYPLDSKRPRCSSIHQTSDCNGMPSIHAATMVILTFFIFLANRNLGILMFILTIIVSSQRIITKAHSDKQVVIGIIIGLLVSMFLYKCVNGYKFSKFSLNTVYVLMGISIVGVIAYIVNAIYEHNSYIKSLDTKETPEWFDDSLKPLFDKKIKNTDNGLWLKFGCMLMKDCNSTPETWVSIEHKISKLKIKSEDTPDVLIGIKSGGAFITNYVAKHLNIPLKNVDYMTVSHYQDHLSGTEFTNRLHDSQTQILNGTGKGNAKLTEEPTINVKGKTVLLIDDMCGTGSTLLIAKDYVLSKGAKKVITYVLCKPSVEDKQNDIVSYYATPQISSSTPWGTKA